MKSRTTSLLRLTAAVALGLTASAHAEILSFDGNQATGVTTHTLNATDWADYVGGSGTFNSANDWGRLYWRGSAGDGQYVHFDLSSLTGLTLVAPATVTLQNGNATWGGGVDGSFVATANGAWTAGGGQTIPGATAITNAVNATGGYGNGAAVSWGIGATTFQSIVDNPGTFNGLAVIGGSGSQLHFTGPMNPYLTVKTGTISALAGVITADTGSTTWNASNYGFAASNAYSPVLNTLTITGELAAGESGAGAVTINNGGTVAVSQAGNANYYWALDGTTINAGGKLTINAHSNVHNLTLAGGELASTGTDATWGGWGLPDATTVNGGVTSTISAQQITLSSGVFHVDAGATLNFTGSTRAGSLTKDGDGTMKFSAYQNFTGGTTVNGGTLELAGATGGSGWLRGSVIVNPGGTLAITGGDGTGFGWNNPVTNLTVNGGTVNVSSAHIGFGAYMTVALNDGGTITGSWNWNGNGLLGFSSSGDSTSTINGMLVLRADNGASHTFNVADGAADIDLQVNANLTDQYPEVWWVPASALVKTGAGTMALSGTNTYNGSTTVAEGTLSLTSPTLDDIAGVVIAAGAKMDLNFEGNDIVGSLDIDGSGPLPAGVYNSSHPDYGSYFTGTGSLVIPGANGTWTSLENGNWGDAPNWAGNTIAIGYDATATFNAATGVTVTVESNRKIGNLAFDVSDYTLAGSGVLTLDASGIPAISVAADRTATITANLSGTRGMEKTGPGKLVFTGVKSYTGGTTVTGGTLELAGGNSGNSIIRGALTISPGATVALTGGDGSGFGWNNPVTSVTIDGGTLNATGSSHLGFGSHATMTLGNGGSLQGNWQWNGDGLLGFSSDGDSTNTISGNLNLRADGGSSHTFHVDDGASATDLQIDANLSDQWPEVDWVPASGLTKSGTGTMILTGTNTYDGNTAVNDGALEVTAAGSLHFRPTSNGATNSVSGSATGALSFLGTVDLDLRAAVAAGGNVWNLFNLASFTSAAPTLDPAGVTSTLGAFAEGPTGTWELPVTGAKWVFTEADGNLAYVNAATPYETWGSTYGLGAGTEGGDLDNDGVTNFEEFAFGLIPNSGSSVNPISSPLDKTSGQFAYQRLAASELTYSVWYSTDLSGWTEDTGAIEGTPAVNGEVETVPVTISNSLLANPKLFIQVRAE
ncbi:MAG: autotransporter-associated beta strand repeat-containing protein [Verrucomicrobia bacterium]|nr:autotransporter-associated beta strand repeat-containing protein [Verrucomicrobiota bacterium]